MTEKTPSQSDKFPEVKPTKPTDTTPYISPIIGKLGYDTERPWLFGLGVSPNNGIDFHVFLSFDGLSFDENDIDKIWNGGTADRVKKEVDSATAEIPAVVSAANAAASTADSAVAASKVNSDAIVAQSEAISEAKSAMDSATAEIQQTAANAASDAAKIRADVARVQNEVDTAKAANSASVEALKSDIGSAKKDLADVHDSLTKAQSAIEQNQKLINDSVAKISNDIAQDRKDLATAQQSNADLAKQLDDYSKQAEAQGKTIKSIQNDQNGFTATLADVKGNVSQVSDKVDGLSASLKDARGNVASVKAQADQLSATLTDHSKDIANLTATAKELSSTLEDASGRLSKVEQTASEQSTTLSDVQGDLSQVKQTADGLVTTLKDAQGDIDQIKQTAKGTAEQLSNAQGDITSLQKDVNGIKLTITDHDNNIHTLQADSKTLKDDMADAKGNISSLQKTATSLDSEFEDHDGRLSKVEQTASTLTNEFSDQQGHLNRVEQTAQGTQQTVANQQDQINTIKTDAAGIHEALTGQGNQITTINTTLDGLNTKYEGVSGDLDKLKDGNQWKTVSGTFDANQYTQTARIFYQDMQAKNTPYPGWFYLLVEAPTANRITQNLIKDNSDDSWSRFYNGEWSAWTKGVTNFDITSLSDKITTNTTQIDQNKKAIALKADQSTVDNLSGEVSKNTAQLKVQADQISSKVSSEDFNTLDNKVGGAIAQIQKNSTAIDQTDKKISLKADQTEVDKIKGAASHNSSRLDVLANEIKSKVSSTDVNNIVDGKGYATTSTVQSLITQKAGTINESITNLTSKVNKLKPGTVNILRNTDPTDDLIQGGITGDKWVCASGGNGKGSTINLELPLSAKRGFRITDNSNGNNRDFNQRPVGWDNDTYLFSIYARLNPGKSDTSVGGYIRSYSSKQNKEVFRQNFTVNSKNWKKFTFTIDATGFYTDDTASFAFGIFGTGSIDFAEPMLVRGNQIGDWTPAPSDNATVTQVQQITASIDGLQSTVANKADKSQITQLSNMIQSKVSSSDFNDLKDKTLWKSTDSIDLNTAVSQQKIFVKGGSNLPPGTYWWYVQVESGYDSRIVQYAVSDHDNLHYSRQYDGSKWSAWSQGATESEITQLRDDINLRVKSGDLLSQINIQAGRTLIQSKKIFMNADTVVMGPDTKAFIPNAAIINLDAAKIESGFLHTDKVAIGDNSIKLDVANSRMTFQGSSVNPNYTLALQGNNLSFQNSKNGQWEYRIQHGVQKYETDEDGLDFDVNISDTKYSKTKLAIGTPGAMVSPSLFIQTDKIDGNWMGWTRNWDNPDAILFHTYNDEGIRYVVGSGAQFLKYVYISGYARAQGWLTNSTLSKKTNIAELDTKLALDKIRQDKQYTYEYIQNLKKGENDPQASFIIDDVNAVSQYTPPREFVDRTGKYREPAVELSYLVAAVQELDKTVQQQAQTIKELKEKANG